MKTEISQGQIEFYNDNGFVVVEDFLNPEELAYWRKSVTEAVDQRKGIKIPGKEIKTGEDDGINKESDYFAKVFDQLINLWQTNDDVRKMMLDQRIGKMAAELAGVDGIRIWHDQALIKRPWANPTSWHLDTPYWSFTDRRALSIWVALDDVTLENGCMFFIPGSHKTTSFDIIPIGKNMDAIFDAYPEYKNSKSVPAVLTAGSCTFHCGLTIHGAHANMTKGFRRAMTCAYMPDGNNYNGIPNILGDEILSKINVGDPLDDDHQNPLIYSKTKQHIKNSETYA